MAKDLHDSVAQIMSTAKLYFISFRNNPEENAIQFDLALNLLVQANEELRNIYNNLFPSILKDLGFKTTLEWYSENYLEPNNIKTEIIYDTEHQLSQEIEINLYRIIQESISNIIKYSQATKVKISINLTSDNIIQIEIKDNGIGFDLDKIRAEKKGFGLTNIYQRVNMLKGSVNVITEKNKGTKICIKIPVMDEKK